MRYLQGTAELNLGDYGTAADILSRLLRGGEALPPETLASARFFTAWALYRGARYAEAFPVFAETAADTGAGGYFSRASYYGAWCAFSLGRFSDAAALLEKAVVRAETDGGPVLRRRSRFLLGQTYAALGRTSDAAREYRRLFTEYPNSEIAADAHFEFAGLLRLSGDVDGAAAAYKAIPGLYPGSPLGESALMRRARSCTPQGDGSTRGAPFTTTGPHTPREGTSIRRCTGGPWPPRRPENATGPCCCWKT